MNSSYSKPYYAFVLLLLFSCIDYLKPLLLLKPKKTIKSKLQTIFFEILDMRGKNRYFPRAQKF